MISHIQIDHRAKKHRPGCLCVVFWDERGFGHTCYFAISACRNDAYIRSLVDFMRHRCASWEKRA